MGNYKLYLVEAYSEPCQTSKIQHSGKTLNDWKTLTIFAKRSILNILRCSECATAKVHSAGLNRRYWHCVLQVLIIAIYVVISNCKSILIDIWLMSLNREIYI